MAIKFQFKGDKLTWFKKMQARRCRAKTEGTNVGRFIDNFYALDFMATIGPTLRVDCGKKIIAHGDGIRIIKLGSLQNI